MNSAGSCDLASRRSGPTSTTTSTEVLLLLVLVSLDAPVVAGTVSRPLAGVVALMSQTIA